MELHVSWKKASDIPVSERTHYPEHVPENLSDDRKRRISVRKRLSELSDQKDKYLTEVWDE